MVLSFHADLFVAADGIHSKPIHIYETLMTAGVKSRARELVLSGIDNRPRIAGLAAYRVIFDVKKIKVDPEVSWLLGRQVLNIRYGSANIDM